MNTAIISGNLTADIDEREINDKSLCKFAVACNQGEQTLFMPVEAWNMAHLPKYLHKGSKVLLQGYLKQDNWETDAKEKRSKIVLVCQKVDFLDPAPRKNGAR